jgi:glucosamine-phosphate N-acetyltransferase
MNTLKHIEFKLLELKYLESYVHLLRQLSDTMDTYIDDISEHYTFTKRFLEIQKLHPYFQIWLMIDKETECLIGCGTIILEPKFIHELSSVAHIEDLCIDKHFQMLGYGRVLINYLQSIAVKEKCYKIILNCSDKNIPFYERCGFNSVNVEMSIYLDK